VLEFPGFVLGMFLFLLCVVAFDLYLRRVLRHLDPSRAIPGRVRAALDTLTEGLLVLDRNQHVVLANQAIAQILGRPAEALTGTDARSIGWLSMQSTPATGVELPWRAALEEGRVQRNALVRLRSAAGAGFGDFGCPCAAGDAMSRQSAASAMMAATSMRGRTESWFRAGVMENLPLRGRGRFRRRSAMKGARRAAFPCGAPAPLL